jgi:Synergist-CTERM protein sorting domain-containing protein
MKRFCLTLFVLCAVVACAACAWAGSLSATYTYDGTDVTNDGVSGFFQIEAEREVEFSYEPGSYEGQKSYTISFTDGTSGKMTLNDDGDYICKHKFSKTGEIGIRIDASGFTPVSADITEANPFELDPVKISMKPNEANRFVKFKGESSILNYDVDPVIEPAAMAQAAYQSAINPPRITVTANSSEGPALLNVTFTNKSTGKSFKRICFININEDSRESNMSNSGGGGGCSAGFAAIGLFALLPVLARRKTK